MPKMPRAKYDGPSKAEMRKMRAESMARDAMEHSPMMKDMTRLAEKHMKDMEKAVMRGFKDASKQAGGRA